MKYSINVPDSVAEAAKARAAELGITPAEFSRRALLAALDPSGPSRDPDSTREETRPDLERVTAERDTAREDLAAAGVRIAVLEAVANEKDTHIKSLQSAIATVAAAAPPALPETAGEVRRPWWKFW